MTQRLPQDAEVRPAPPGPSVRDWLLLAVNLTFVAMGLFILPHKFDVGIVTLVFFGFCALAPITTIVRKRRNRSFRAVRAGIIGGVRIKPSRARAAAMGLAMVGLGATLIGFGGGYPMPFRVVSGLVAGVGVLFSLGVALGKIPVGHLLFTPRGITIGHRNYAVSFTWDDIAMADAAEFNDNPLLRIWLKQGAAVSVEPPAQAARAQRNLASSQAWMGAPIAIMTGSYGLDLPLLLQAIERYVTEPASRAELDSSRLLPS